MDFEDFFPIEELDKLMVNLSIEDLGETEKTIACAFQWAVQNRREDKADDALPCLDDEREQGKNNAENAFDQLGWMKRCTFALRFLAGRVSMTTSKTG